MRTNLSILVLFFYASNCFAQESRAIDSLKSIIETSKGEVKFEATLSLMRQTLNSDPNYTLALSEDAYRIALDIGDSLLIVKSIYAQGFVLRRLGRANQAIDILTEALAISIRNGFDVDVKKILNLLGISYMYAGNYDKSLEYHFRSLEINEKTKDVEALSLSQNNIGVVYFKLMDFENASLFYERSLTLMEQNDFRYDYENILINAALCYNQLKNYDLAEKRVKKALNFCKENCSDDVVMQGCFALGASYFERGLFKDSEDNFTRSLALSRKLNDKRFICENLLSLSVIYTERDQVEKAIETLTEAEKLAEEIKNPQLLTDIYQKLSNIYGARKDYERASNYREKYIHYKDSIYSKELIKNLATVQTKYAERENLSTIKDNQKVIRAQRNLNYAISIIVLLSFSFMYLVLRNIRMIRRLNTKLAEQVLEKTKDLKISNYSLKQVNDELDNLIYKTSHDIRGPLASLKGICNIALMDVKDPVAQGFLKRLDHTSSELNIVLDKFSRANEIYNTTITPKVVDIDKVVDEILALQQKTSRLKPISIIREGDTVIGFETEPQIFYYALSCVIDNAFRYYNESQRVESFVKISVKGKNREVIITVTDNGIGIPINIDSDSLFHMFTRGSEKSLTGGMGLFIASTAVRKLQGEIRFERSHDLVLTEFILTFPMKMDPEKIVKPKVRASLGASAPTPTSSPMHIVD